MPAAKTFVIGLPRTGTTSLCAGLLDHGLKVGHTAYTVRSFELAEVVADTPCYCDYVPLDQLFPGSRFVYLNRPLSAWLPSIQQLLQKMQANLSADGHFNPIIKRCFTAVFALHQGPSAMSIDALTASYQRHQRQVQAYFAGRDDCLSLQIDEPSGLSKLLKFLDRPTTETLDFPHLNANNQVSAWGNLKHPNKINSRASGTLRRRFFDYPNLDSACRLKAHQNLG